jgi:5-methylcytosine-specific restriction endonuclease McrA
MEREIRKFYPTCVLCGSADRTAVDHILPLSKGYGLEPGNATILCKSCNSTKHNKDLERMDEKDTIVLRHTAEHFRCHWNLEINVPAYLEPEK